MKNIIISVMGILLLLDGKAQAFGVHEGNWLDENGIIYIGFNGHTVLDQFTLDEAIKACPNGMHLPTARELAKASVFYGAKILEEIEVNPTQIPKWFYLMETVEPNGITDKFYYNRDGYRNDRLSDFVFWSSSRYRQVGVPYNPYVIFSGYDGNFLDVGDSRSQFPVRCFKNIN